MMNQVLIIDEADLLTDYEETMLTEEMQLLTPYGNVMFSSVVLRNGADYEENSEDTYYSYFGNEPGVNFQIDMGNRKLTLSSSMEMDDLIRDERDSIVDNIYMFATEGDYYECASECYSEILAVINDEEIAHSMKHIDNAILALLLALLLNFFLAFFLSQKKKQQAKILGNMAAASALAIGAVTVTAGARTRVYDPPSSSSGGSGGGSGGGGGFSGGSSSHGF